MPVQSNHLNLPSKGALSSVETVREQELQRIIFPSRKRLSEFGSTFEKLFGTTYVIVLLHPRSIVLRPQGSECIELQSFVWLGRD